MLNVNEKMDRMEETEKNEMSEAQKQKQLEDYNLELNVNYFGAGRSVDDWH